MKKLKHTYRLPAALILAVCLGGCAQDDDLLKTWDKEESGTRMSLVINTPTTGNNDTSYQYEEECYINDVAVYLFETDASGNDTFKEKVSNPLLSGDNGFSNGGCRVYGTLNGNYAGANVKVVVLTNLEARGVVAPALNAGDSPEALFNLTYSFTLTPNNTWKFQESEGEARCTTPMYGVSGVTTITEKKINEININLYRAIARVDVVFGGEGFQGSTVNGITLNRYNTKGTCATDNLTLPKVPAGSSIGENAAFFIPTTGIEVYPKDDTSTYPDGNHVWRLYIPEYKNIGSTEPAELTISIGKTGTPNSGKTYTLQFIDKNNNDAPMNIIRNNLYIFRITSITQAAPVEDINCSLEVEEWTPVNNEVTFS